MTGAQLSRPAVVNHALLSRRPIDSSMLTVRGALFHRIDKPGRYEVFVRRAGRLVHREVLDVVENEGATQLDVRLGLPEDEERCCCGRRDADGGKLQSGGVLAFHAARGTASYQVLIERWHAKGRDVELDSRKGLAAGDLFAAALVMPGRYRVLLDEQTITEVRVRDPDPKKPHRTDQPVLVKSGEPQKPGLEIDAGTCVVLWLDKPGTVRFQPLELLGEPVKAK
jgi:hypothetical protein